jgi:hypothetical protein
MLKNFRRRKLSFLGILTLILIAGFTIRQVNAQGTQLSIIPATLTVGAEGQPLPTEPFTINITLTDFEDVYTWQIRILFNPSILNCTTAWYPEDHIFAGKTTAPSEPVIDNSGGSLLWGNSLVGAVPGASGSRATLCQINFTGVATGVSQITFQLTGTGRTFLLDSNGDFIEFTANPGEVTVVPEFPSILMLTIPLAASTGLLLSKKFAKKSKY